MGILTWRQNTAPVRRRRTILTAAGVALLLVFSGCNSNLLLDTIEREVEDATTPKIPNMLVRQGGDIIIADDTFSFGYRLIGNTASVQFSIRNEGNAPLLLQGSDPVSLQSTGGVFSVLQPNSPIPAGGTANFYIQFTPNSESLFAADVTILSNDPDNSILNYQIEGRGTNDDTGPSLIDWIPETHEANHLFSEPIWIQFDEQIDASTLNAYNFEVSDLTSGSTVPGTRSLLSGNMEATFTPDNWFIPGHEYRVILTTAIQDPVGNYLDDTYVWNFTVKATDNSTSSLDAMLAGLDIDSNEKVTVYFLVYDQNGAALEQLSRFNFVVKEGISGTWTEVDYSDLSIQKMATARKPKALTFIIDNSGSVGFQGLNVEKMATNSILGNTAYFNTDDYGAVWSIGPPTLKWDYTQSAFELQSAINSISIESGQGASIETAYQALDYFYNNSQLNGLRALILNFDGNVQSGGISPEHVADLSRTYNIPVFPLGFYAADPFMDTLTTGGYSFYSPNMISFFDAAAYEEIYDQLFDYLDKAYTITWPSTADSGDTVNIEITVNYTGENGSWSVLDTDTYTLP